MEKNQKVLTVETESEVSKTLNALRSLGDSLICIGTAIIADPPVELIDGTLQGLGHLIIDGVDEAAHSLGIL
jgi:hypothetical protein